MDHVECMLSSMGCQKEMCGTKCTAHCHQNECAVRAYDDYFFCSLPILTDGRFGSDLAITMYTV